MVWLSGCAWRQPYAQQGREAYWQGDVVRAEELLSKAAERRRDRDCAQLDRAMAALVRGDVQQAELLLRETRDRLDHLQQASAAERGLSLLTDERAEAYAGEPYERVLVRTMLTLSSLLGDGVDAMAYSLQIEQEQAEVLRLAAAEQSDAAAAVAACGVAVGAYVQGAVNEATHARYDEARRAYASAASWSPAPQGLAADVQRATAGVHSAPGHGALYVLAMVGQGPIKQEVTAEATSAALLLADQLVSAMSDHSLPPTIAPVKIAEPAALPLLVDQVAVRIDGHLAGQTWTVTDVVQLAYAHSAATRDARIARAVARRCLKKGAVYGVKDATGVEAPWAELAFDAAGVAWEALERADTRCWALLPAQFQTLRLELPVGVHRLELQPQLHGTPVGPWYATTIVVTDGDSSYALAAFPSGRLAGRLVTSSDGFVADPAQSAYNVRNSATASSSAATGSAASRGSTVAQSR
jgi:hypothetical protein